MGPLSNLVDGALKINGIGWLFSQPLGYVIIRVQVEGVKGYNEDQVAQVVLDQTTFASRVLVTLGTPTINQIVNVIKESEIDELSVSLNGLRIFLLLAGWQAELSLRNDTTASLIPGPTSLNEAVKTMKWEEIEAFSSKSVHGPKKTVLLANNMYVMTQTSEKDEEPHLPHGLSVVNTYTEMSTGSRCVTIVIKNQIAVLIIITKGIKVSQVVAVNRLPSVEVMPWTLEKTDKIQGVWWTKMSIEHRKEMLLQQLDLAGLEGWSRANCTSAHVLLTKYHDIFSLEPREFGCMGLVKHEIRVVDDEPFKERFQRIPPPMVEEVRANVKEMLEAGTIFPSQGPWCNTVVLVRKKDGGLCLCIDFCKLNVRTKKDSYPLPHTNGHSESHMGWVFLLLGPESRFLADCHGQSVKTVCSLHGGEPRIFWVHTNALRVVQCPCNLPEVNVEFPRPIKPNVLTNLLGWHDCLFQNWGRAFVMLAFCVQTFLRA